MPNQVEILRYITHVAKIRSLRQEEINLQKLCIKNIEKNQISPPYSNFKKHNLISQHTVSFRINWGHEPYAI